jgi:[ribosomal protein S18]-alanine N-acetyltransferase
VTSVRRADPADLDALASLERVVFGHGAWSPRSLEEELERSSQGRLLLVAADGGEVVGYAALSYNDDFADLLRVAVHPDRRRQGVARRLCEEILADVGLACTRVMLEVAADNPAATALYSRLGFAEIDRRRRYYGGSVDAVVMERVLPAAGVQQVRSAPGGPAAQTSPVEARHLQGRRAGEDDAR